jgi:rsbT co-antagonist protein RsbR
MLHACKKIDQLLDSVVYIFSQVHIQHTKQIIESAYRALEELSIPIVPLGRNVAVLPIVGDVDGERSNLLMEIALNQSSLLELEYLIIDISGVLNIDTMVANKMVQIFHTLALTGVKGVITGIRPEIAKTLVLFKIRLEHIQTYSSLDQALEDMGLQFII